jgi:hypothetical protein
MSRALFNPFSSSYPSHHPFAERSTAIGQMINAYLASDAELWLDWARIQFRFFGPSSFNTALQLVMRPHFLVHFV